MASRGAGVAEAPGERRTWQGGREAGLRARGGRRETNLKAARGPIAGGGREAGGLGGGLAHAPRRTRTRTGAANAARSPLGLSRGRLQTREGRAGALGATLSPHRGPGSGVTSGFTFFLS